MQVLLNFELVCCPMRSPEDDSVLVGLGFFPGVKHYYPKIIERFNL